MADAAQVTTAKILQDTALAESFPDDDDFTPEELSLVQQLLTPERFLRVLSALRATSDGRPRTDPFNTPGKRLQRLFEAKGLSGPGTDIQRGGHQPLASHSKRQTADSSDDEGVTTPPRHTATAASAFQGRLAAAAASSSSPWNSDDEEDSAQTAAVGSNPAGSTLRLQPELAKTNAVQPQRHEESVRNSPSLTSGSDRQSACSGRYSAEEVQQPAAPAPGNPTVRRLFCDLSGCVDSTRANEGAIGLMPQWASQQGQDRESVLQRLQRSNSSFAGSVPALSPSQSHMPQRSKVPHIGKGALVQLPVDSDDNASEPDEEFGKSGSSNLKNRSSKGSPKHGQSSPQTKSRMVQLPGKDSVQRFLTRINSLQRPHIHPDADMPLSPSDHQRQWQQPETDAVHQSRPTLHASSSLASTASWSRPQQRPLTELQQQGSSELPLDADAPFATHGVLAGQFAPADDVASSPVQAAVAAVASRLQLVQQGLSSAEGRLAHLTGRRAASRQHAAEEDDKKSMQHQQGALMQQEGAPVKHELGALTQPHNSIPAPQDKAPHEELQMQHQEAALSLSDGSGSSQPDEEVLIDSDGEALVQHDSTEHAQRDKGADVQQQEQQATTERLQLEYEAYVQHDEDTHVHHDEGSTVQQGEAVDVQQQQTAHVEQDSEVETQGTLRAQAQRDDTPDLQHDMPAMQAGHTALVKHGEGASAELDNPMQHDNAAVQDDHQPLMQHSSKASLQHEQPAQMEHESAAVIQDDTAGHVQLSRASESKRDKAALSHIDTTAQGQLGMKMCDQHDQEGAAQQESSGQHSKEGLMPKASKVSDMIRRFDSGSSWGSSLQSPGGRGSARQSPGSHSYIPSRHHTQARATLPAQESSPQQEEAQAAQGGNRTESALSNLVTAGEEKALIADSQPQDVIESSGISHTSQSDQSMRQGSLAVPQQQGQGSLPMPHLRSQGSLAVPLLEGQGSLAVPQLRGQGSFMRGDLWLPQQWLEPADQLQDDKTTDVLAAASPKSLKDGNKTTAAEVGSASPKQRMQAAMEAVRAAERAVQEVAAALSPTRSNTL